MGRILEYRTPEGLLLPFTIDRGIATAVAGGRHALQVSTPAPR